MKLAHDIYKQFIEIQSGYSTGSTTPIAEAAAARLKKPVSQTRTSSSVAHRRRSSTWSRAITAPARRTFAALAHTDVS